MKRPLTRNLGVAVLLASALVLAVAPTALSDKGGNAGGKGNSGVGNAAKASPGGTTRPEPRTRSGSSSLMTTRSKRGRSRWFTFLGPDVRAAWCRLTAQHGQ